MANADPNELLPVLMQAQPNKVRLGAKDEEKDIDKLLAKARIIADSANRLWREFSPCFPCQVGASSGLNWTVGRVRDAAGSRRGVIATITAGPAIITQMC